MYGRGSYMSASQPDEPTEKEQTIWRKDLPCTSSIGGRGGPWSARETSGRRQPILRSRRLPRAEETLPVGTGASSSSTLRTDRSESTAITGKSNLPQTRGS